MDVIKDEAGSPPDTATTTSLSISRATIATPAPTSTTQTDRRISKRKTDNSDSSKRRCVSSACVACRRRKSKCDGHLPACAACASVYGTECVYDPNSDHRRKGVYKKDVDNSKLRNTTLQTLIQAILNYQEEEISGLVKAIRTCDSLEKVAEMVTAKERGEDVDFDEDTTAVVQEDGRRSNSPTFEAQLSRNMGTMKLDDGRLHFVGGTSNLIYNDDAVEDSDSDSIQEFERRSSGNPMTSWTTVTSDPDLITHLLNHYFTWHYTFFTILPKASFYKQFLQGKPREERARRKENYCSPLLVNTILSLGCHFTSSPGAREDPLDAATAGDHFFKEAKRLLYEGDELAKPNLATVQALALMSVREAGCAREADGWVYSGMAFRMSCDLGLSFQSPSGLVLNRTDSFSEEEDDARRVTFWGCFQIDKCWSNYLGRMPQFQLSDNVTVPHYDVLPTEEADTWAPYSDSGFGQAHSQPSRVRAVALQISALCDISSDLIKQFYNPQMAEKPASKQVELKRLGELHTRLEEWRRNLPKELEPREGILSSVLIMHMFFQLLYIHLFRPFLKYTQATSPLPSHVSPRKLCTQAAGMISKLMRLYKRSHGLRQIVNFAIYVVHSACTIHLLNLPDKTAKRDIIHGVKHLEEMAEGWLVARRTLSVMSMQVRKWKVDLPEEAAAVLSRTDAKFGLDTSSFASPSPKMMLHSAESSNSSQSFNMAPPTSQPTQAQKTWQQTPQTYSNNIETLNMNTANYTDFSHSLTNNFSASTSETGHLTPQTHTPHYTTPQYPLSPVTQDFSPRSSMPRHRLSVKRTATGSAITQHARRGTMQPPSYSQQEQQQSQARQQQANALPQQQQARPIAQANRLDTSITATTLQQQQAALRNNTNTPAVATDMFGGVEALLREGQEWWMKDQSRDLASGFGNWNDSASTDGGSNKMNQQPHRQSQSQEQQQAQPRQHQSNNPQQRIQQHQQQQHQPGMMQNTHSLEQHPVQQQQPAQQQQLYATKSAPMYEVGSSTTQLRPQNSSGGGTMSTSGMGVAGGGGAMYDFGSLEYNEDEWYQ